jgi:hypothetical protein
MNTGSVASCCSSPGCWWSVPGIISFRSAEDRRPQGGYTTSPDIGSTSGWTERTGPTGLASAHFPYEDPDYTLGKGREMLALVAQGSDSTMAASAR